MSKSAQEIVNDIDAHLQKSSAKYYSDFCIGLTNDINRKLFNEQNVPTENHWYKYRKAINDEHSRAFEKHNVDKGMQGGVDDSGTYVYYYNISSITNE